MEAAPVMKQAFSIFSGSPPVSLNLAQASETSREEKTWGVEVAVKEETRRRRGVGGLVPSLVLKSGKEEISLSVAVSQAGGWDAPLRSALISPDLCLPVGNYTVPKAYPVRREQERNGGLDQLAEIGSVQRALRGKSAVWLELHLELSLFFKHTSKMHALESP